MVIKNSEAARISDLVYGNPDNKDQNGGYDKNYKFLEASAHKDSAEGFFGAVFEKDNNIVIAFRGTNSPFKNLNGESITKMIRQSSKDLEDDLFFAFNRWGISKRAMPQYQEALEFAKKFKEKYAANMEVIITGHSLGGALAQLVGIALKEKVISFDAPGVLSIARNLFSQDRIDAHKTMITTFTSGPNFFNTIGKQIVKPIQISVKTSSYNYIEPNAFGFIGEKILQTIEFRYWQYSKEQHDSERIYQAFNSVSGEPTIIVDYEQWPTWTEAKEQFYSHCILESNPSEESDESYIDVFDVLDIFSDPEIADPKLSNVERFRKLAESQRELGNEGLDESFKHMADQTQAVLDALDNKEPNNNGFQFDPSIFEAAKQDFNLNDYLSDEDNNPLSSFQKIMDTVSKQRNNDPSLDNIDLLQNLATDQLNDGEQDSGDLFSNLADQTASAMKALGIDIDLNENDN